MSMLRLVVVAACLVPPSSTFAQSRDPHHRRAALANSAGEGMTLETLGDASIVHERRLGIWTIAAAGARLTIIASESRSFEMSSLVSPSGQSWIVASTAGTTIDADGRSLAFGSRSDGFRLEEPSTSNDGHTLRLDLPYLVSAADFRATRHFVVTSGSPTFETWTTFESIGRAITLADLNAFQFAVPAGTIHALNGLQGDAADVTRDTAFTLRTLNPAAGTSVALGAQGRSSEQSVPWLAVDGAQDEFYAALMWSGSWSAHIDRSNAGLSLSFGLAPMTTTIQRSTMDGPHGIFGIAAGRLPQASAAMRSYVLNGLREGRSFSPLVTYNTWFAYGTDIDETTVKREMDGAATLGVELFVVDAGWYAGAGANGPFDFDSGLGSWEVDSTRFPDGLRSLSEYAHGLGMKFGIWVEPERLDLSTLESNGADESWLATNAGNYGSDETAVICLSGRAARQWLLDRLTALIETAHPDYIKFDNNAWVNCDRSGHGHGVKDGNFAQVTGLYEVLATIRDRYPDLLIENVSGGGNRLDFGMLRYTDVAWMDDRTAPSVHVRHNLEGLAAAFPPAYLLSFVTDHEEERLHDAADMSLYFRSRMAGALGLCFRTNELSEDDSIDVAREIDIYKNVRATLGVAAGALLTAQAAPSDGPEWDVLEAAAPDGISVLLYAYQSEDAAATVTVRPANLQSTLTYAVNSVDAGPLGTATGSDLMTNGVQVVESPNTAAHILVLTAQQ